MGGKAPHGNYAIIVSSVDDFSTQVTSLEQIYLLLHAIESRL
jgi:hypothetical protein